MIDIIIPAYNAHDTIIDTLMSLSIQKYKEMFNVYICNDCSDKDYSEIIKKFDNILKIKELKLEKNVGPGVARQYGIDNSNSEYIVFIDSDDVLFSPISIKVLYDTIVNNDLDMVIGNFKEETDDGYYDHNNDTVWLHGKIYRRKFIIDKNIRFNNSRNNEDNYFNKSFFIRNPRFCFINDIVYLWKNNEKSITRKNNHEYEFTGLFDLIDNLTMVIENAANDNIDRDTLCEYTLSFLLAVYFNYLEFYNKEDSILLVKNSKRLKELYDIYHYENKADEDRVYADKASFYFYDKNKTFVIKPVITFEEFLELYNQF